MRLACAVAWCGLNRWHRLRATRGCLRLWLRRCRNGILLCLGCAGHSWWRTPLQVKKVRYVPGEEICAQAKIYYNYQAKLCTWEDVILVMRVGCLAANIQRLQESSLDICEFCFRDEASIQPSLDKQKARSDTMQDVSCVTTGRIRLTPAADYEIPRRTLICCALKKELLTVS